MRTGPRLSAAFAFPRKGPEPIEMLILSRRFEEEPGAALCLVDPDFDQAGGGIVVGLGGDFVRGSQALHKSRLSA